MKSIKIFSLLILALSFFACEQEQIDPTVLDSANHLEEFNLEVTSTSINDQTKALANAANGGAQVIRDDADWGFRFTDDETGIHAFVNVTFEELCGGDRIRSIVDVQDVLLNEKDGTDRIITLWKGKDVSVNVYESAYRTCTEYENAEPLYSGIGDFIWTDNNFGQVEEGDQNSAGFRLHGDGVSIIFSLTYNGETVKSRTRINLN